MDAQDTRVAPPDQPLEAASGDNCLDRARRGDLAAFRDLMCTHQSLVFSVALRFMGQRPDAEELLQDVFLQLHAALAQINNEEHLKRWLLRAISHRCIDRLRHDGRKPRLVPIATLPAASEPKATEREADHIAGTRLRQLLLELAPDARAVLLLRFQEDLDPMEIATVLSMPVPTVKSHLRRSLEWMRARLEGDDHES
jgi:RNA polymerase sigma-70 factor (ECF subfamily)